jgi:peroxidase
MSNRTMEAGDARSNENLILLSFQTLFLREHNRICDLISRNLKNISDDVAFTIARNFVIGLIQKITYDDFLPILLGPEAYK